MRLWQRPAVRVLIGLLAGLLLWQGLRLLLMPDSPAPVLAPVAAMPPSAGSSALAAAPALRDRAQTAEAAASPAVATARRPDRTMRWSSLDVHSSLAEVLEAAKATADPDLRAAALYIASICLSLDMLKPHKVDELKLLAGEANDPERLKQLQREMVTSMSSLRRFCQGGDFNEYASLVHSKQIRIDPAYSRSPPVAGQPWAVDPRQWDTMMLATPERHPYALQRWAERQLKGLLPADIADDDMALDFVRRELIGSLTGSRQDQQLLTHFNCLVHWICPARGEFTAAEQARLKQVAESIAADFRQQRWDRLGLKPG